MPKKPVKPKEPAAKTGGLPKEKEGLLMSWRSAADRFLWGCLEKHKGQ